mgnify:CR=1 FL=1
MFLDRCLGDLVLGFGIVHTGITALPGIVIQRFSEGEVSLMWSDGTVFARRVRHRPIETVRSGLRYARTPSARRLAGGGEWVKMKPSWPASVAADRSYLMGQWRRDRTQELHGGGLSAGIMDRDT